MLWACSSNQPGMFSAWLTTGDRGKLLGAWDRGGISRDDLVKMMAGGAELDQLAHELERATEER